MRRLIEPMMAAVATALLALPQDETEMCEHAGRGPTTAADVNSARGVLAALEGSVSARVEEARRPSSAALPRCPGRLSRKERWADLPKALGGKTIRFETAEGVSPDLLRGLKVRCLPTEVRFLAGGEIEWVEE